ncbi:hypothetical protein [Thiolapillus sp.]|nr:hypothetical protein [Thiolapillus sp.]
MPLSVSLERVSQLFFWQQRAGKSFGAAFYLLFAFQIFLPLFDPVGF